MTLIRKGSDIEAPKGERCKRCFKVIREDGHEGFCLADCHHSEREEVSQATLRKLAFERDQGVCFYCKASTEKERAELDQMREWLANPTTPEHAHFAKNRLDYYRSQRGYLDSEIEGSKGLWEAHHVTEKARGGPNTLANIATACAPCHAKLSGDFSRIRKVARKPRRGRFGR